MPEFYGIILFSRVYSLEITRKLKSSGQNSTVDFENLQIFDKDHNGQSRWASQNLETG
jgi:hypothetical protein